MSHRRIGASYRLDPRWICALLGFGLLAGAMPVAASPPRKYELADLEALQRAFAELAEQVRPSVVTIQTYQTIAPRRFHRNAALIPTSKGSGFVLTEDGYIATNRHVLLDATEVAIKLSTGDRYDATIVQVDERSDLAVLKIDAEGLVPVQWGDLSKLKVNHWTFACGNPFGLAYQSGDTSVSFGAVSAMGRNLTERLADNPVQYYGNLIETTSPINPGSSGGPLFNIYGEVIGVVTAIETASGVSEGAGFAIPMDKNARRILDTLKSGKEVRYGLLGVQVSEVRRPRSRRVANSSMYRGALISSLSIPGGPADKAGLKPNDIIIEFGGAKVKNQDHLIRLVGYTPVGAEATVTYLRAGVKRRTTVVVGDREELLKRFARQ